MSYSFAKARENEQIKVEDFCRPFYQIATLFSQKKFIALLEIKDFQYPELESVGYKLQADFAMDLPYWATSVPSFRDRVFEVRRGFMAPLNEDGEANKQWLFNAELFDKLESRIVDGIEGVFSRNSGSSSKGYRGPRKFPAHHGKLSAIVTNFMVIMTEIEALRAKCLMPQGMGYTTAGYIFYCDTKMEPILEMLRAFSKYLRALLTLQGHAVPRMVARVIQDYSHNPEWFTRGYPMDLLLWDVESLRSNPHEIKGIVVKQEHCSTYIQRYSDDPVETRFKGVFDGKFDFYYTKPMDRTRTVFQSPINF